MRKFVRHLIGTALVLSGSVVAACSSPNTDNGQNGQGGDADYDALLHLLDDAGGGDATIGGGHRGGNSDGGSSGHGGKGGDGSSNGGDGSGSGDDGSSSGRDGDDDEGGSSGHHGEGEGGNGDGSASGDGSGHHGGGGGNGDGSTGEGGSGGGGGDLDGGLSDGAPLGPDASAEIHDFEVKSQNATVNYFCGDDLCDGNVPPDGGDYFDEITLDLTNNSKANCDLADDFTAFYASTDDLFLILDTGAPLTVGTYELSSGDSGTARTAALFLSTNSDCTNQGARGPTAFRPVSGTIKLTSVPDGAGSTFTGSYDIVFDPLDELKGSFTANVCASPTDAGAGSFCRQ